MPPIESPEVFPSKIALRIYPLPSKELSIDDLYLDLELPSNGSLDPSLPYLYVNMVSTLDGRTSINGKANNIGGSADRRVMRNLRAISDGVLRGGATLRAERIQAGVPDDLSEKRVERGLPPQPLEIILTKTKDISILENLIGYDRARTILLTGEHSKPLDLKTALRGLREKHHIGRLLLESGPDLNNSLVSQGLLDELFLTVSPKLVSGLPDSRSSGCPSVETLLQGAQTTCKLLSAHLIGDDLFLRYSLR